MTLRGGDLLPQIEYIRSEYEEILIIAEDFYEYDRKDVYVRLKELKANIIGLYNEIWVETDEYDF